MINSEAIVKIPGQPSFYSYPGMRVNYQAFIPKEKVIEAVSSVYGFNEGEIYRVSRKTEIVQGRNIAIMLLKKHSKMNLPAIARVFEKDHSTIIHSLKTIEADMAQNEHVRDMVYKVYLNL